MGVEGDVPVERRRIRHLGAAGLGRVPAEEVQRLGGHGGKRTGGGFDPLGIQRQLCVVLVHFAGGVGRTGAVQLRVPAVERVGLRDGGRGGQRRIGIKGDREGLGRHVRGQGQVLAVDLGLGRRSVDAAAGIVGHPVGLCRPMGVKRHVAGDPRGGVHLDAAGPGRVPAEEIQRLGGHRRQRAHGGIEPLGVDRQPGVFFIHRAGGVGRAGTVQLRIPAGERAVPCDSRRGGQRSVGVEGDFEGFGRHVRGQR